MSRSLLEFASRNGLLRLAMLVLLVLAAYSVGFVQGRSGVSIHGVLRDRPRLPETDLGGPWRG